MSGITCTHCHKPINSTNYGITPLQEILCYDCCAVYDNDRMIRGRPIDLYVDLYNKRVTNWVGNLSISAVVFRKFVRFIGPDKRVWSGRFGAHGDLVRFRVTKIDPTEVCHVRP